MENPLASQDSWRAGDVHLKQGLQNLGSGSVTTGPITYNNNNYRDPASERTLREALQFSEMQHREFTIEDAHEGTCSWFLRTEQYATWTANPQARWQDAILWIKGSAGAGKSTIMKFAVDHAREQVRDEIVLAHFFNARAGGLQKSIEGMYRTLLVWLLDELPPAAMAKLESTYTKSVGFNAWPVPELVRLFKAAVNKLAPRPLLLYVDALDECKEEEALAMLKVLRAIVKQAWESDREIRVCFASRPFPDHGCPDAVFLPLSDNELHRQDIATYVKDELNIGTGAAAEQVYDRILAKAGGIFMWTKLVVDLLNKEYNHGKVDRLLQLLEQTPAGLRKLYAFILQQYPEGLEAMSVCLIWVLFAQPRLTVRALWWAVQRSLGRRDEDVQQDYVGRDEDGMRRYIISITKGLVEASQGYCQVIHESVRDFVFAEVDAGGNLQKVFCTVPDVVAFEGQAHEKLRDWCLGEYDSRYPEILAAIERSNATTIRKVKTNRERTGRFLSNEELRKAGWTDEGRPLARHSAICFVMHAEAANRCGLSQSGFLDDLSKRDATYWLSPLDLLVRNDITLLRHVVSLLIESKCDTLIRDTQLEVAQRALQSGQAFGIGDDGECAISAVLGLGPSIKSYEMSSVQAVIDMHSRSEARHPRLQRMLFPRSRPETRLPLHDREHQPCRILEIGCSYEPPLATSLLLTSIRAVRLEPYLDILERIVEHDGPAETVELMRFVWVVCFVLKAGLPCGALDPTSTGLLEWAKEHGNKCRQYFSDYEEVEDMIAVRHEQLQNHAFTCDT